MSRLWLSAALAASLLVACDFEPKCEPPLLDRITLPTGIDVRGDLIYVVNSNTLGNYCSGYVTVHDRFSGEILGAISASTPPGAAQGVDDDTFSFLSDIAASSDGTRIYVSERETDSVLVYDISAGTDAAEFLQRVPAGVDPYQVAELRGINVNDRYFISNEEALTMLGERREDLFDAGDYIGARNLTLADFAFDYSPRDLIFTVNLASRNITLIDPETFHRVDARRGRGSDGSRPELLLLGSSKPIDSVWDERSGRLIVVSSGSRNINIVNLGEMVQETFYTTYAGAGVLLSRGVAVGRGPMPDRNYTYIASREPGAIQIFDHTGLKMEGAIPVCDRPSDIETTPDGERLIVACYGESLIQVYDLADRARLASVPVRKGPERVVIAAEGDFAYVTNYIDSVVTRFDLATLRAESFK